MASLGSVAENRLAAPTGMLADAEAHGGHTDPKQANASTGSRLRRSLTIAESCHATQGNKVARRQAFVTFF